MLRLSEIALFLAPVALFAAWWILGTRGRWLAWAAFVVVLLAAGGTAWFGLSQRLPRGQAYVPARLDGGRVVSGHGV